MPIAGKGSVRAIAVALLVLLPLALPFEAPLLAVGPLTLTTSELALYLAVAAWAVQARPPLPREPLAIAVALWLAVVAAAALLAPAERAAALKFAARSVGGGLLFFAARDLGRARAVALAVVAAAALAALVALVETWLPAELFRPFRAQGFTALGETRAAGPFAYPTIAAMFWEAALPLTVLLGSPLAAGGAAALLAAAIILSATRAALAGALVAAAALVALSRRRAPAAAVLAATAAVAVYAVAGGSLLGQRLRAGGGERWLDVAYTVSASELELGAGALGHVPVTVENRGTTAWPASAVHLAYHWEDDAGRLLVFDGWRTLLPADVAPGERVALDAAVRTPAVPGRYRLRWDLVREGVTWASEQGVPTADQQVVVTGPAAGAAEVPHGRLQEHLPPRRPGRLELWRAALALWRQHPLLGVGPDNFRHLHAPGIDDRLHANSLYLETLADLGLAGAAALAFLGVALLAALRAHARSGDAARLACAVAAATFFVHGAVDTFLAFTPLYALQWLLLGLAAPTSRTA